jgi:hypothetical protein
MHYGSTNRATNFRPDPWQVRVLRSLLFFIPKANPDNESLYPLVRKWYLELDDSNLPVREIGLGENEVPLFAAPDQRNYGFWTDSSEPVDAEWLQPISAEEFHRVWNAVEKTKTTKTEVVPGRT